MKHCHLIFFAIFSMLLGLSSCDPIRDGATPYPFTGYLWAHLDKEDHHPENVLEFQNGTVTIYIPNQDCLFADGILINFHPVDRIKKFYGCDFHEYSGHLYLYDTEEELFSQTTNRSNSFGMTWGDYSWFQLEPDQVSKLFPKPLSYHVVQNIDDEVTLIKVPTQNGIVGNGGGSFRLPYTILNPVGNLALNVCSNDSWIHIDSVQDHEIHLAVEYYTGWEGRKGSITLNYPGKDNVVVRIYQKGSDGKEPEQGDYLNQI